MADINFLKALPTGTQAHTELLKEIMDARDVASAQTPCGVMPPGAPQVLLDGLDDVNREG